MIDEVPGRQIPWSFLIGSYAFVAPLSVSAVGILWRLIIELKHPGAHIHMQRLDVDPAVMILSAIGLGAWFFIRRWFIRQSSTRQVLLAAAAWAATLAGYAVCIII